MPKKTRKAKVRASQRAVASGYRPAPVSRPVEPLDEEFDSTPVAPVAAPVSRSMPPASARAISPVTTDYRYVFRDLRRIAILAGLFFAIMIVLYYLIEVQHIAIIPGIM